MLKNAFCRGNSEKTLFIAENEKNRGLSRYMVKIAISHIPQQILAYVMEGDRIEGMQPVEGSKLW